MAEITGGELLLRCLHAEGVRHINAITDGTYMMVIEALERLGEEICGWWFRVMKRQPPMPVTPTPG